MRKGGEKRKGKGGFRALNQKPEKSLPKKGDWARRFFLCEIGRGQKKKKRRRRVLYHGKFSAKTYPE